MFQLWPWSGLHGFVILQSFKWCAYECSLFPEMSNLFSFGESPISCVQHVREQIIDTLIYDQQKWPDLSVAGIQVLCQ